MTMSRVEGIAAGFQPPGAVYPSFASVTER